MVPLCIIAVALLAISRAASAEAFSPGLARDESKPSIPEPLVFYNLTREEFSAKVLEYRGTPKDERATSDLFHLDKRVVVGFEFRNPPFIQSIIEARSSTCSRRFGEPYRLSSGYCSKQKKYRRLGVICRVPGEVGYKETSEACPPTQRCVVAMAINYLDNWVKVPYCGDTIEIQERTQDSADVVPTYEGHRTIPDPAQMPEPPHSPSILDSIDQFWEVEDGHIPGLKAQWDYRGHYSNGNGFSSRSLCLAHSWSCVGCPAGTLYVSTNGFKSQAVGSVML